MRCKMVTSSTSVLMYRTFLKHVPTTLPCHSEERNQASPKAYVFALRATQVKRNAKEGDMKRTGGNGRLHGHLTLPGILSLPVAALPALAMAAGVLVAGGVHAVKATAVRPAVTATTGGAGNVPVSILEDVLSTIISIFAVVLPVLFASVFIIVTAWVVWLLWRRANRERAGRAI